VGRAINFESFALRVIKFGRFSASLHQAGEGGRAAGSRQIFLFPFGKGNIEQTYYLSFSLRHFFL